MNVLNHCSTRLLVSIYVAAIERIPDISEKPRMTDEQIKQTRALVRICDAIEPILVERAARGDKEAMPFAVTITMEVLRQENQ